MLRGAVPGRAPGGVGALCRVPGVGARESTSAGRSAAEQKSGASRARVAPAGGPPGSRSDSPRGSQVCSPQPPSCRANKQAAAPSQPGSHVLPAALLTLEAQPLARTGALPAPLALPSRVSLNPPLHHCGVPTRAGGEGCSSGGPKAAGGGTDGCVSGPSPPPTRREWVWSAAL